MIYCSAAVRQIGQGAQLSNISFCLLFYEYWEIDSLVLQGD